QTPKKPIHLHNLEMIGGIGASTAESLYQKGLSVELILSTPIRELVEIYGLSSSAATKYQSSIVQNNGGWFNTAYEVLKHQQNALSFTYGVQTLDELMQVNNLNNLGITTGDTYEYFGQFRTGKTQICHQLCVTVQLPPSLGGLGKKAIYIDTENTFSASKIINIANRFQRETNWELSINDILKNITYARVVNSDQQRAAVYELLNHLNRCDHEYGLLIIDSVISHFRSEFAGRGTLAERQQLLNNHLSVLDRIANSFNLAIVITNQVQSNPNQFFGDPTSATGGNIIGHWAKTRFYLRKSRDNKRIIKIYDSAVLGDDEAVFAITEEGIIGVD
ncbi:MAG: DNA repair and recombination protein RadA, partial [Candidatus Kariarchaeaceae archaeon]